MVIEPMKILQNFGQKNKISKLIVPYNYFYSSVGKLACQMGVGKTSRVIPGYNGYLVTNS